MLQEKILLVDDDEDILNLMKFIFEGVYEIYSASNGKEALEVFSQNDIDLIITDCVMPELDGIELIEMVRKTSKVPIIAVTGVNSDHLINSLKNGATEILSKPFTRFDLEYKISNIFKNKESS